MTLHTTNYDLKMRFHTSYCAVRGYISHHKAGHPPQPIELCITSALYNTSKFLMDMWTPIQNLKGYSVSNFMDFTKQHSKL